MVNLVPDYDEVFTAQCVQAAENNDKVASGQYGQAVETNPLKMFEERYWTEEWIATLGEQSKNYAHQKGIPCTEINAKNMKVFYSQVKIRYLTEDCIGVSLPIHKINLLLIL